MTIKDYLPKGLFGRTFLIVMVPVLLLQITVAIVFFDRHWSKMTERLAFSVAGEIAFILNEFEHMEGEGDINALTSNIAGHLNLKASFAFGKTTLPPSMRSGFPFYGISKDLSRHLGQVISNPFSVSVYTDEKTVFVYILTDEGRLTITVPEGRLFSSSSYIFILWMIGLSLLLFTVAMIFLRNQIRPIYRLGIVAERLGRGIPVGKIKPTGAREVRQTAEAFASMQDRLNEFIGQRTTMLAGVSHDLKTPLTRMKLQLEMMGDTPDTEALRRDIIDMEQMIGGYLSFAKGDGGEEMQRMSLQSLLNKTVEDARRLSLNVEDLRAGEDDKIIWMKPKALARAFDNFISNAARHADTIRLSTWVEDGKIHIVIEDNGEGIAPDKIESVMKPFVRGEASRNQKTGGVGLGLTIANDVIVSQGGRLKLSSSQDLGGLRIDVMLLL